MKDNHEWKKIDEFSWEKNKIVIYILVTMAVVFVALTAIMAVCRWG